LSHLNVHFLPELVAAERLAGSCCVVIDVLRAMTTVVYALAAGARAVIPCSTIEDAQRRAAALPAGQAVLGGERGGLPIAGFHFGNSPGEYTAATVSGKTVVLTTTNGTNALLHCRQSAQILIGAFANLSAVCSILSRSPTVDLVCAGTDGQITHDDALVAGAIVARLSHEAPRRLNDQAALAENAWQKLVAEASGAALAPQLVAALRDSRGGRNLIQIGMAGDIELAAAMDRFTIVPRFDPASGEIEVDAAA
jgi:2-phosphosulfolactate phosphatase